MHGACDTVGNTGEAPLQVFDTKGERLIGQVGKQRFIHLDMPAACLGQTPNLDIERVSQVCAPSAVVAIGKVRRGIRDGERSGNGDFDRLARCALCHLQVAYQERLPCLDLGREAWNLVYPDTVEHGTFGQGVEFKT